MTDAGLVTLRRDTANKRRPGPALPESGEAVCRRVRGDLSRIIHARLAGYSREDIAVRADAARRPHAGAGRGLRVCLKMR